MSNWKSYLNKNSLEWLLEDNNPSVKYFTLIDIMDTKPNSSEVMTAKSKIMTEGMVPKILKKQNPEGYWGDPLSFYLPKRKVLMTMELFRWLAVETAQRWGYSYPALGDQSATVLVKQLLSEMK